MTDAAGIEIKGRKEHSKKRRRKEWREEVDRATTYHEYCQIEIYEPTIVTATPSESKKYSRMTRTVSGDASVSPKQAFGALRRRNTTNYPPQDSQVQSEQSIMPSKQHLRPPRSPTNFITSSPSLSSPSSPMKKSQSCLSLHNNASNASNRKKGGVFGSSTNSNSACNPAFQWSSPFKRNYSSNSLPNSPSSNQDSLENDENCPRWEMIVKEDLGMAGSMLLTTMARLKEARMQASSMNDYSNNQNIRNENGSNCCNVNEHDEIEQDKNESEIQLSLSDQFDPNSDDVDPSLQNPSSKSQKTTVINEDCSSSLKFLLSGIVKRNHLSVDDFLINDARSVAERGQHSLRRETREAIDRYGEELERCIDWVASGPIYSGGSNGCGVNDVEDLSQKTFTINETCIGAHKRSSSKANAPFIKTNVDSNSNNSNFTPGEIMQKQCEELSKRFTLLKRMKQNMGHTALMLSGGGAQAMYHLGTIKALVESELYGHIHVISGTSGGR